MSHLFRSPFVSIFQAEVLLNTKRVAPYAMAILCGGNALLWWGWGPATGRGLATNSESFIAGCLPVYSFMTLPLFTALIMADPVIRDFRFDVAPLIFSKPVSRAEYLLGKFFGNFFVLAFCQAAFVLTLFVLQAFRRPGMIVQDVRAFPYLKHFLVLVVISHLVLAAFYFTVGTLTRNTRIVYGLAVSFYPIYIAYQGVLLASLPGRWRVVLDPLAMNWGRERGIHSLSDDVLNQLVIVYDSNMIANRALMILIAGLLLTILYVRFTIAEPQGNVEKFSMLNLSTAADRVYYDADSLILAPGSKVGELDDSSEKGMPRIIRLPEVTRTKEGIRANVNKLIAALGVEFRLLRSERSLVVIAPLAIFLSILEVAFYEVTPGVSYSAAYATNTATLLLLFLFGLTVFYTGEAMHRDREVGIEPVLWSTPVPNNVLLLSKFLTTISLALALLVAVGLASTVVQLLRGHAPVEISAYMITYSVILFPTVVFATAAAIALNVLLRDKYVVYAVCIAIGAGLFYFYNLGYNHWLYNPALYQLWTYSDLTGMGSGLQRLLTHRIYWLALSCFCLAIAQLGFRRKSTKAFTINGRLGSTGWALLVTLVSLAAAAASGLALK